MAIRLSTPPAPGGRPDLDSAAEEYARQTTRERGDARDAMVTLGLPLAARLARRYRHRGEPIEDLEQVARLGLVKAVDRYDPLRGSFTAFAVITIIGELRRHFRDHGWGVHVPRRLQELSLEVNQTVDGLTTRLSRTPTPGEVAGHLGISEAQARTAQQLSLAYTATSLNRPASDHSQAELGELLGESDANLALVEDRITIAGLIGQLPPRERRILALRFYGDHTQDEIAVECGISQMHVSRLLSRALAWLRHAMLSDRPAVWPDWQGRNRPGLRTRSAPREVTVELRGEVDRDSAAAVRRALLAAVRAAARRTTGRRVRVDLAGVPFVDAAGMAALASADEAGRAARVPVHVCRPPVHVRRVLVVAGLRHLLDHAEATARVER
jgi:RNA polymerase sigma-B factor